MFRMLMGMPTMLTVKMFTHAMLTLTMRTLTMLTPTMLTAVPTILHLTMIMLTTLTLTMLFYAYAPTPTSHSPLCSCWPCLLAPKSAASRIAIGVSNDSRSIRNYPHSLRFHPHRRHRRLHHYPRLGRRCCHHFFHCWPCRWTPCCFEAAWKGKRGGGGEHSANQLQSKEIKEKAKYQVLTFECQVCVAYVFNEGSIS